MPNVTKFEIRVREAGIGKDKLPVQFETFRSAIVEGSLSFY